MPTRTLLTVQTEDLGRLEPSEAVVFFRELLWAEARTIGLPNSNVRVSEQIYLSDGGIDAAVESSRPSTDLIKQGHNGYQIKASSVFRPWQPSILKKELFGDREPATRENLSSGIRNCLDKGGTYVIVCFKQDLVDSQYVDAIASLKKLLVDCGYKDPAVDIWGQSSLIGFLAKYPSLSLRINGSGVFPFQTHASWSRNDDMQKDFVANSERDVTISALNDILRDSDSPAHVHICGEPGIGKTKLVLEATSTADLSPLVLYFQTPEQFERSGLLDTILFERGNRYSVILVVDECDFSMRTSIWNRLKHCESHINLISIHSELQLSEPTPTFELEELEDEQITRIFESYDLPADQAQRWVEMCDGSPRVAHVFGKNLRDNPEDIFRDPDTVNVWERYICGSDDSASEQMRQRRLVLQHLALFKRFGYEGQVANEAKAIAELVETADHSITLHRFREIVNEIKQRKILQGSTTLYITPKALQLKLWKDWWEVHGGIFNVEEFYRNLTPSLRAWFSEMFKYAEASPATTKVVEELLSENGPFHDDDFLQSELGSSLFSALAEANPRLALRTLQKTIGRSSRQQLINFTSGRRQVVWALEKIAVWRDCFVEAAKLLLLLGEAENEHFSNNASGIFIQLFTPGPGKVAPTEAPPRERFPVLVEALEDNVRERRILAINACDQALESQRFSRVGQIEYQGLRSSAQLWTPETYGEIYDAYRHVWRLLNNRLDTLPSDEQLMVVDILVERAGSLGTIPALSDLVVETLIDLSKKNYVDDSQILERTISVLHYRSAKLSPAVREQWTQLRDQLTGVGFHAMMRRYVRMDVLEDKFDQRGNYVNHPNEKIVELAEQAISQPDLLDPEFSWLFTSEASHGLSFGYEIGIRDSELELLPAFLKAQENAGDDTTAYFLGGYFRALFERNRVTWEEKLEMLARSHALRVWVPELTWRSGMSDSAALRVLKLYESGAIVTDTARLFALGGSFNVLSEPILLQFIEFLISDPDRGDASVALNLLHFYYSKQDGNGPPPSEIVMRTLTHCAFLKEGAQGQRIQLDEHIWTEVALSLVHHYPNESLRLADHMLNYFGRAGTIFGSYFSQTQSVLKAIVVQQPDQAWDLIAKYLGPPIDSRAFDIKQWLRGEDIFEPPSRNILNLIPSGKIWQWVDEDVNERAWYIASFVPPTLFQSSVKTCLAREILLRYGNREDVRRNLMANFSTEGWTGERSVHLQRKKSELLTYRAEESEYRVRQWIDEYVDTLDEDIESAKVSEERDYF